MKRYLPIIIGVAAGIAVALLVSGYMLLRFLTVILDAGP